MGTFFKNGTSLGPAFQEIYAGEYYPGVGLFKNCHVKFNFGPRFKAPPQDAKVKFKPVSDRAKELEIEQAVADMRFFTEHEGKLRIDSYFLNNKNAGNSKHKFLPLYASI